MMDKPKIDQQNTEHVTLSQKPSSSQRPIDSPSPGSTDHGKPTPRRRSCNACRQQKLRCDVVQSPFKACSRCRRTGKGCKVDVAFHPDLTPKRSKMQREIEDLRKQLALATQSQGDHSVFKPSLTPQSMDQSLDSQHNTGNYKIGDHLVQETVVSELYEIFFKFYHPFLPFLDPKESPKHYFQLSPLLGWAVVMVAARRYEDSQLLKTLLDDFIKLLWSTIREMPQSYHICKALCLLCFWPLPEAQNFKGPTYQFCGIMMQIANQNMLHVPITTQYMPFKNIPEPERRDRVITWVACNIVAQSVSNVFGFLPQANFRFILGSNQLYLLRYKLPELLLKQLKVAQYCNYLTETLYCNSFDSSGLPSSNERVAAMDQLADAFELLQSDLDLDYADIPFDLIDSIIPKLHLLAANVQLRAFAFLIPTPQQKESSLLGFHASVCTYLQSVTDFETSFGNLLDFCSIVISRTILSCIMGLLKLLNSPLSSKLNVELGKTLFNTALLTARRMSIQKDDFEYRLSTAIPEIWRELGAGAPWDSSKTDPLTLKVQSRMSFSHGYDCLYHHLHTLKSRKAPVGTQGIFETSQVQNIPFASGPEVADQLNSTLLGPPMDEIEFYNSIDWMLVDIPLASYEEMSFSNAI